MDGTPKTRAQTRVGAYTAQGARCAKWNASAQGEDGHLGLGPDITSIHKARHRRHQGRRLQLASSNEGWGFRLSFFKTFRDVIDLALDQHSSTVVRAVVRDRTGAAMDLVFQLPLFLLLIIQAVLGLALLLPKAVSVPLARALEKNRKNPAAQASVVTIGVALLALFGSSLLELLRGSERIGKGRG